MSNTELIKELSPAQRELLLKKLREKARLEAAGSIPRRPRQEFPPLSFAQQRLLFMEQLGEGSAFNNIPAGVRLKGRLDVEALGRALDEIVRRHESLRTTFPTIDGRPVQHVLPELKLSLRTTDLSVMPEGARQDEAMRIAAEEARTPFDLEAGPLVRARLLRLSDGEHVALFTMHHIVSDGWSMGVLVREVAALYAAFTEGRESPLPELPIQYADYAQWQREQLSGEALERELCYWKERLAGAPAVLELPTDRPRPVVKTYHGAQLSLTLDKELTERLHALAKREGATLFMVLLAGFGALLSRYTGQEDIVVGTDVANRTRSELESLIGFFVNQLALRLDLSGGPSFLGLVGRVREATLGAYAHQEVPFDKVVEAANPERDPAHTPLFQVTFGLQNAPVESLDLPGLKLSALEVNSQTAKFDLGLSVAQTGGELDCLIEYNTDLFDASTVGRMAAHFRTLLEAAVADPSRHISEIRLLSEEERRQILVAWNDTRRPLRPARLHEPFEQRAAASPDSVALIFEGASITYGELDEKAGALARKLRGLGVGPESLVGILMERSPEMVASVLAVSKAGGAYVPLDPSYPQERLRFMLGDSGASVLLTQPRLRGLAEVLADGDARVLAVDAECRTPAEAGDEASGPAASSAAAAREASVDNLAYVIYTSGSTGRPKGVAVTHRSISNRLAWMIEEFGFDSTDRFMQKTPFSFDASIWELFVPLWSGATLVLARPGGHQDAAYMVSLAEAEGVTVLQLVPSLLPLVAAEPGFERLGRLRWLFCGGEALGVGAARQASSRVPWTEVVNLYGPTEVSIDATFRRCGKGGELLEGVGAVVPIGRPIYNVRVYILNAAMEPTPVGVAGELYVGGAGLARGYLRRPALTAERFVPDPFSGERGARLYRTGDVGRWLEGGEVEYVGRADEQVKIRGFRIELGEIEAALRSHGGVVEAAVVARGGAADGDARLVAYVVGADGRAPDVHELRERLGEALPEYMVPSAFVTLDSLPRTPNGKLDRLALPDPHAVRPEADGDYVAPRSETEGALAEIWQEVLGVERVGADDNFFDLGGHSLLALLTISRVREKLQVEIPIHSLFEAPTVAQLSRYLEEELGVEQTPQPPPIERVERGEGAEPPLSYAQQRLWFLDQLEPGSAFYNLPAALRLKGSLDAEALARSLHEIARRHESLRTTFSTVEGRPVQRISPEARLPLPVTDLSDLPAAGRELRVRELAEEEARTPFDLEAGPLVRARLLRLSDGEHVALFTMHHIVSDGWSMGVLIKEVAALYEAFTEGRESPLPELPIQYADYAQWQREVLSGEALERELCYWKERLAGAPAVLELPTDRPRPAVLSYRGRVKHFTVSAEVAECLNALAKREGATLFMTLLAAYGLLLSRHAGQPEVVVGTPVANRARPELESLIGFFVNTLALRLELSGGVNFAGLLGRVRALTLDAYAHQEAPFERLVEALHPERDLSHTPLFQVMFVLQNAPIEALDLPGLRLEPLEVESHTAKFDLTLFMEEEPGGRLSAAFEYSTDLFDDATIDRMIEHFQTLLRSIINEPALRVDELQMLGVAEERRLLVEWNDTRTGYPAGRTIPQLFEEQAARTPDAVAVELGGERLSYGELNERANRLAHHLQKLGVGPESLVGLLMERSTELIVALLGVLKAGGAYVPLDPESPPQRLAQLAAGLAALVTTRATSEALPRGDWKAVRMDADWKSIARRSKKNPQGAASPDNLAYVMYTSGSTGRPKGVAVPHRAVVRLVKQTNYAEFDPGQVFLQLAPAAFDAATFEIWGALLNGARLVVMPPAAPSLEEIGQALARRGITTLWLTAGLFHLMVDYQPESLRGLRQLLAGGDVLSLPHVRRLLQGGGGLRLINGYGPTENTTFTCCHTMTEAPPPNAASVPIGRPISNTQVYILDEHLRPVATGVVGELYTGGEGLARGYYEQPELTAEKFIPNPFSDEPGARLYRTEDFARYLPDGRIEFVGRRDQQVKLRGFRIELGEVEAALAEHEAVREAAAVVRRDERGEKRLVAYIVEAAGSAGVTPQELRAHLSERLPDYMVPQAFVTLERLPLTPNGKVDRRALPEPEQAHAGGEASTLAPRDSIELQLVQIWEEVLERTGVGVRDNFFDLGGHSLLAVRLMALMRQRLGRELPLSTLFEEATIEHLASELRQQTTGRRSPLVGIQTEGTRRPFFCVHAAGGGAVCYTDLARRLGPGRPFYGLQALEIDGGEAEPATRIEEMAAHYVEALRGVQPEGPYLLGGWSLGGVVAFEMARQLAQVGQRVSLLALLDTHARLSTDEMISEDDAVMLELLVRDIARSREQRATVSADGLPDDPEERLKRMLAQMKAAGLVPPEVEVGQIRRYLRNYRARLRALRDYTPRAYESAITLFRASDPDPDNPAGGAPSDGAEDETLGWAEFSSRPVEVVRVPGYHGAMIYPPHVAALAEELEARLREAESPDAAAGAEEKDG